MQEMMQAAMPPATPHRSISKFWFCFLAITLGGLGGHWWYALRQAPRHKLWQKLLPYIALFPISVLWGWVDVLRHGLMSDEQFNMQFNPLPQPKSNEPSNTGHNSTDQPQSNGWVAVLMVLALGFLAITTIALLALLNQWWTMKSIG